jgi:hypothetical protein
LIGDLVCIFYFRGISTQNNILILGWFWILQKNNLVLLFVNN